MPLVTRLWWPSALENPVAQVTRTRSSATQLPRPTPVPPGVTGNRHPVNHEIPVLPTMAILGALPAFTPMPMLPSFPVTLTRQ
jgi:hypothetical protein